MENFEFKKRDIDLSEMKNNLNEIDAEFEKELSEITQEFYESGLSINDFCAKKFSEDVEKSLKKSDDLHKMSMEFKEMDGIFANLCKNTNRFTGNVVLVNIEDLTEDFKNGNY
jgi:DNA anti-recombination protein RmuC